MFMYTSDVIIIFDAMRWDLGSKEITKSPFEGSLCLFDTKCRCTPEWYNTYWNSKTDRILISENPMPFHKSTNFAHQNFVESHKVFGSTWMEVEPQKTFQKFEAIRKPEQKYLIHFLAPHLPFIFGKGKSICTRKVGSLYSSVQNFGQWDLVRKYYCEQIKGMLDLLYENIHLFDGYTVTLTSDHGEIINDFGSGIYNHPHNASGKQKELLGKVPYFEISVEDTLMDKRLKMLGYL